MAASKRSAAGVQPAALKATGRAANEQMNTNPPKAVRKMQSSKPRLFVRRQCGEMLSLTGKSASVAQALIIERQAGLSRADVQPWCWDLASAIRDLRALLGREAIKRIPGDRRRGLPCRYQLMEALAVIPEALGDGRQV
jgi:hypothetical protein